MLASDFLRACRLTSQKFATRPSEHNQILKIYPGCNYSMPTWKGFIKPNEKNVAIYKTSSDKTLPEIGFKATSSSAQNNWQVIVSRKAPGSVAVFRI